MLIRPFFIHVDLRTGDEKTGFVKILVEREGKPALIDNPRSEKG